MCSPEQVTAALEDQKEEGKREKKEGGQGEKKNKKVRKEGRRAADLINLYQKLGSDLHSDVALPVTFVLKRSRSFMPTGRCHCVRSPARKKTAR